MISAIVATYGRLEVLKRTLPTVLEQDLPSDEYEVVVVLDGPDAATFDWLLQLSPGVPLSIVQQRHLGLAAARNAGLRKATGETVVLLDNDLLCEPRLLRVHAAAHRGVPLVAFGPVLVSPDSPHTIASEWVKRSSEARTERLSVSEPEWVRDIALCANYSAPRQLLLSSGGFDESFVGACEEFDLGIRLRRTGIPFRYLPEAVVKELYVKTARDLVLVDSPVRGRNEVRLCRKHPEYRPVSVLARFNQGAKTTRLLRHAAIRVPFPVETVLAPTFRAAEATSGMRVCERIATRLLEFRRSAALFRSAKKEAGSCEAFRREFNMALPVLLYHKIGSPRAQRNAFIVVSPKNFERQMRWLTDHGYAAIGTADWLAWRNEGRPLPKKPVMITFDDAYATTATTAFPIIREYGLKATVFIVTSQIGGINAWDVADGLPLEPLMSADQIRHWAQNGIEFGVHTRTHPDLRAIEQKALEDEVLGGEDDLRSLLGVRPLSFAYPFGYYNNQVSGYVSTVFQAAFTCDQGLNRLSTNSSLLRRTMVLPGDSLLKFSNHISLGWSPFDRLIRRVRLPIARTALGRIFGRTQPRERLS